MLLVGIFTQCMIEGVEADVYSGEYFESFGETTCETIGTHFDLNDMESMNTNRKLLAVGGTTTSEALRLNEVSNTNCLSK